MKSKFLCSLLLLSAFSIAQTTNISRAKQVSVVNQVPGSIPQLDEATQDKVKIQILEVQNFKLESEQLRLKQDAINSEARNLVMIIEQKYPGYTLDFQTGSLIAKEVVKDTGTKAIEPKNDVNGKPIKH